ncbi:MAG: nicotinamide-nucleotide amidohydrolase family protein [Phycisphaeraceae bacterium]|nr:nicotinamide-nucleotide amidohydrolase family protein [Phycisphaeraceae bacterium]
MLAVAESCTGGLIGATITSVAGSSACFAGGFIVYANEMKQRAIGVSAMTLEQHGAVSRQCAIEMANGALEGARADIAVAVTGIAGPDGGTETKPVGTVWIGLARHGKLTSARHFIFPGDRQSVRVLTVQTVLQWILALVCEKSPANLEYEHPTS